MDVDGAPRVALETRVEELGRVRQRSSFGERELHNGLVRLARADDSVVRPRRVARTRLLHPLHFLDDVRVRVLDELAHPAQCLPAPVVELGDPASIRSDADAPSLESDSFMFLLRNLHSILPYSQA